MTDIDTQIESLLKPYHDHTCHSLQAWVRGMTEPFPCDCDVQEAHKAIKTLLIQSKIEELEAIMDFDDEPVHLNFDEEVNPIMVGERIDQLKEQL